MSQHIKDESIKQPNADLPKDDQDRDKIEDDSAAWQAYLESEKEWEEVYRRLANS